MTAIETVALILVVIALLEFALWVLNPELLLDFSELIYGRPAVTQGVCVGIGGVILVVLLQHLTIVEIMATTFFASLLMGVGMAPFGTELTALVREKRDQGRLWRDFALVWIVWLVLLGWTVLELGYF